MNPDKKIVLPRSDEYGNFECVLGKAQVLDDSGIRRNVFTRMCEAAPITNLAFSGGGARGIAYAGVVLALDEVFVTNPAGESVSIRSQIESVSGSSAGAITAAFFATGMPANEFVESAKQVDVSILLDSKQKNRVLLFGQDGEPFYKYIRDTILRNICSFTSKLKVQSLLHHEKYNGLSKEHKKYIGDLQSRIQSTEVCYFKTHFRPRITFGHLEALRMLEPSRFKKLTVIAADSETGLKFVFSSQTTPDFEIAKACRASASIPLVLKPVTVKVGPTKLTLIDGGYVDNIPAYEAGRHQEMIPGYNVGEGGQNLSTLVFLFDETTSLVNPFTQAGSEFRKSIFSSVKGGWVSRDLLPRVFGAIKGPTRLTVTRLSSLSDVQEFYSMRNIALKVDGISTVDFKKALNIASTLIDNARKQTTEFFQEHGGTQRTFERYDSIDELLTKLAPSKFNQLNNILNKAAGTKTYFVSLDDVKKNQEKSLSRSGDSSCQFKFNDAITPGGDIPCISDQAFAQRVSRFYPPRRKSSRNPEVFLKGTTMSVRCFETPWMFGVMPLIGEYEDSYQNIAKELGIMIDMHESEIMKFMDSRKWSPVKFRNLDPKKAVALCQKIDSAESFFTHVKSIVSELNAYLQYIT